MDYFFWFNIVMVIIGVIILLTGWMTAPLLRTFYILTTIAGASGIINTIFSLGFPPFPIFGCYVLGFIFGISYLVKLAKKGKPENVWNTNAW